MLWRPSGIMKFLPLVTGYAKLVTPVAIGAHHRDLHMAIRGVLRRDPVLWAQRRARLGINQCPRR